MKKSAVVTIATLSLLTFMLTGLTLFRIGPLSTFYTIDPDVPYLGNALLYIASKTIALNVHPGTPTIIFFSHILFPLRLYTHFVLRTPFISWTFENIQFVYHYVRYFQSLLLSISVAIFLLAVYKNTKSKVSAILAWLSLFIFSALPYFGTSIVPETTSFFLVSLWLLAFASFLKFRSPFTLILMSFLAGVALANKFTNFPIIPITITLAFCLKGLNHKQRLLNIILFALVVVSGFLISTWPIRHTLPQMLKWVTTLASTTGIQGGGEKAIFDLASYVSSAKMLIHREILPFYLVVIAFLSVILSLFTKRLKFISPLNVMAIWTLISFIVFSKYPLSHYQLTNYLLAVYIAATTLNNLPNLFKGAMVAILVPAVMTNMAENYSNILQSSQKELKLEQYLSSHPPAVAAVWEWGRAKDFALLWTRDWTGMFTSEISQYRPNLYELSYTLETIKLGNGQEVGVFDACWDQLYIQRQSSVAFLAKYDDHFLKFEPLPDTDDMGLIRSIHCSPGDNK